MDVSSVSKNITNITTAIQKNIKPISNLSLKPLAKRLSLNPKKDLQEDIDTSSKQTFSIEETYLALKQNCYFDYKITVKIVSCLKLAEYTWKQYQAITNKNGQISAAYLTKFEKIQKRIKSAIASSQISGSVEQVNKNIDFLAPIMSYLDERARKFYAHQNQFKIVSKMAEENKKEQFQQEEEIKEEMIDLVEKFKSYALNIQEDLVKDKSTIQEINKSQDIQLKSLENRSTTMTEIINRQRLGFIQLLIMGVIAALLWVFGLTVIIIT